ncbi:MAG TPA: TMEM165/GDT1 family protein [Acidimicrobiales bacterium]
METLLAALGLVFVAEMGDKTQLVALGLGARHRLAPVLAGITVGYTAAILLSVGAGGLLGAALPTRALGLGGGVLFLGFAVWTLRSSPDPHEDGGAPRPVGGRGDRSVALSVAATMFVAEMGDKTMLATAALAAQGRPLLVWVGATAGILLAGALGVLAGRFFGARLPERATRIGSAAMFAAFGLALVAANV